MTILLDGMVLAAMYALRDFGTALVLGTLARLSSMIATHGVLDTLFAALALSAVRASHASRMHRQARAS